ncbi:MAG: IS110 family transposase [Patescibacteria group bacterium]
MDVSDKSSTIHIIDERGAVLLRSTVFNDPDGVRQFFEGREKMSVGIEACGISARLTEEIEQYGHDVKVLHPQTIGALTRGRKTDRNDAEMLAQILRGGWYREVHKKSDDARLLRTLIGTRGKLVEIRTQLANEIQGYMKHWGSPVGSSQKANFYERVNKGLERIPDLKGIIGPLMNVLEEVRLQVKDLDRQIENKAKASSDAKIAMSHPGVGPVVAMAYLATIDDASRFRASRQVGAYLGLTARVYQSGETTLYGRITKEGDKLLRGYLLTAANALLTKSRKHCKLKAWGLKLSKKKGYSKAKVAVARRISVNLHRMLVDQKPFDYGIS